ncbi:MAG: phage baseplate assembly protein V [Anaerolineae bacterium]
MSRTYGVVTGEVVSVEDPQGEGRVRVRFPWLPGNNQGYWAPVATLMGGGGRGSWFMPEVGDEVLVAFDQGDVRHPYIVGFLWNGADRPPNAGINASVRRLRTVSGHVVEFDDNAGQERILIKTQGGHQIEMKDTPPASITIQTTGGNQITISDAPPGITISTQGGTLTVNCLQANVNASTLLNVTAPLTVFNGIVQVPTLVAQAVVGSAYTPAPGNTFGL